MMKSLESEQNGKEREARRKEDRTFVGQKEEKDEDEESEDLTF